MSTFKRKMECIENDEIRIKDENFSSTDITLLLSKQENEMFIRDTWAILNQMRKSGWACDGILATEDGVAFPVHRLVMVACSPYFKTAFTTRLVGMSGDSAENRTSIVVPSISSEMLEMVIEYAYNLCTPLNKTKVYQILQVADQFCIEGMIQDCCAYLQQQLSINNCIHIWQRSSRYYCENLSQVSFRYILRWFQKISMENGTLVQLPHSSLLEILESDELIVSNEYQVWCCIKSWVSFDVPSRLTLIPKLLRSVRFGLLPLGFFQKMAAHPFIKDNNGCAKILKKAINAIKYQTTLSTEYLRTFGKMTSVRYPRTLIFSIGGWSETAPTHIIEIYDKSMDRWTVMPDRDPDGSRAYHQIQLVMDIIYVFGGTNGRSSLNSCQAFNLSTRTWKEMTSMHSSRCYLSSVILGDCIYVMGGFNGLTRLDSVEKFNPTLNQWFHVTSMNCHRSDASACVLSGKIIVCGGFDGTNYLNTVEVYDPNLNTWSFVSPMTSKRSGLSCISFAGRGCFVIGGFNGLFRLPTVELYNIDTDHWSAEPKMHNPRSNFSAVVMDNNIYVCGGYNGMATINSVEKYDLRTHTWNFVEQLNIKRSALSSCIVEDLENMRSFLPQERTICYNKQSEKNMVNYRHWKKPLKSYPFIKSF